MRLRALVGLLVLTAGDYLLWDWSIAGGHDVLSLVAGLTLLPLTALSAGFALVAVLGLLTRSVGSPSKANKRSVQVPPGRLNVEEQGLHASASTPGASGRLAA